MAPSPHRLYHQPMAGPRLGTRILDFTTLTAGAAASSATSAPT